MTKFKPTALYMAMQSEFGKWFGGSAAQAPEEDEPVLGETVENDRMFNLSVEFYVTFGVDVPIFWEDFSRWAASAGLIAVPAGVSPENYIARMYSIEKQENSGEWVKHTFERNAAKDRVSAFGVSPEMNDIEGVEPFVVVRHSHGSSIKIVKAADRIESGVVTKQITSLVQTKEREMKTLLASLPMDKAPAHLLPLVLNLETQLKQYNQRIHHEGVYLSQNFDSVAEMVKKAAAVNDQKLIGFAESAA